MTALDKHHLPPRGRTIGMWLFLASLTMLFLAALLAYVLVRVDKPDRAAFALPWPLAASTAALILGSVAIELAVRALEHERVQSFQRRLLLALLFALAFIAIQTPSLLQLLAEHEAALPTGDTAFGLVFVLILLHALHVLGGVIPLCITLLHARRGRYDHENTTPIRHLAIYWHFLDAVWLIMLAVIAVVR